MRISKSFTLIVIGFIFSAGMLVVIIYVHARNTASTPQASSQSGPILPTWSLVPIASKSLTPVGPSPAATNDGFDYDAAASTISKQGFTIEQGPAESGSKGPLRAFVVICTGSADGHCGTVDFFYSNRLIGYLPSRQFGSSMILPYNARIVSEAGSYVTVDLDISGPNDPLCCPSRGTINVTYSWTGRGIVISGSQAAKAPKVFMVKH